MKDFLSKFGLSGFWTAKKSTLIGLGIILLGAIIDYMGDSANPTAKLIAAIVSVPFLAWRGKMVADGTATLPSIAPKGFLTFGASTVLVLAALVLVLLVVGQPAAALVTLLVGAVVLLIIYDPRARTSLLVLALLAGAGAARAEEPDKLPATLCLIGQQGNWCYGILPSVSVVGIDVRHGNVVGGLSIGTSLAATWMPGQLKSITLGLHAGLQSGSADVPQTANLGATVSFLKGWLTVIADWQAIGGSHGFVIAPALNPLAAF